MSAVETRTRAAMDAITETIDRVPPLRLPPPSRGRAPSPRRWTRRLAPVGAAAAVLALAVALTVVKDIPNAHPVPDRSSTAAAEVPRYYVTLYSPPQPATKHLGPCGLGQPCPAAETALLVGDTVTGAKVAIMSPPSGTEFSGVAAAADDRTFVAYTTARTPTEPSMFYLLRLAPGPLGFVRLTRLPIRALTGVDAIALSGSGRELAVTLAGNKIDELRVYSVASGKLLHRWSTSNPEAFGTLNSYYTPNRSLAWIDGDRAVAFAASSLSQPAREPTYRMTWRRLNVAAQDGDLMADSKVIWSATSPAATPYSSGCLAGQPQLISADGKTVVCGSISIAQGTPLKPVSWRVAWLAFSVPTGSVRTLYQIILHAAPRVYELWTSTSGDTIIGEWSVFSASSRLSASHVGVISNGTFRQLPSPPDAGATAPSVTW